MPMRKLHKFAPGVVEHTLWAANQVIGEEVSQNRDPIEWIMFWAEIAEEYGEI